MALKIIEVKNPTAEGIMLVFNSKVSLNGGIAPREWWMSWDKIAECIEKTLPKPPWGTAAGGGTTPRPGGLDALGVVKELKAALDLQDDFGKVVTKAATETTDRATRAVLYKAWDRADDLGQILQQLISRLEGQGAEKPADPVPDGQQVSDCQHTDIARVGAGAGPWQDVCVKCGKRL